MKARFALSAIALASFGVAGCGGSCKTAASHVTSAVTAGGAGDAGSAASARPSPSPSGFKRDNDEDNDSPGKSYYDEDDSVIVRYGHAASPADRRAVAAVVKRYYNAAAAGDGARGCSLMYSLFAETIPEEYGRPPAGPPGLRGKTCEVIVSKLFSENRRQLVADNSALRVTDVRIEGNRGWAVLSFKTRSAHRILVHRERQAWKIDELLDSATP